MAEDVTDDDALLDENLEEALEDLGSVDKWAQGAVLWSTDWTAETILSQLANFNIDLDPSFQRRPVWNDKKQSLFIESLILGLPIPQLILAEAPGRRGSYIVIDGKQRLLALRRFGSPDSASDRSPLKLSGLSELRRLNKKTYADLRADYDLAEDRAAFENSAIRTLVIRNWKSEEYLYEVFLRINTGSVKLSPQELRQALHPGPFSRYVATASAESDELKRALNLSEPDFRMRDAEILLRYLAYRNYMDCYAGNLKLFLDDTTKKLNAAWQEQAAVLASQVADMERAIAFTRATFGEDKYLRKWNGAAFEPKKNRAVFDIMLHFFSRTDVRQALESRRGDVVGRFVELCSDETFRTSLESTTKSMESNRVRFNRWGGAIEELTGLDLSDLKFPG
jgi:hypothetical protein